MRRLTYILLIIFVAEVSFSQVHGGGFNIPSSPADTYEPVPCEIFTTVTTLRNAMNAGTLVQGCTYTTPLTYGECFGTVEITFTATATDQISQNVTIDRQGELLHGRYNIAGSNSGVGLLEVKDHRGNEVEGYLQIGRFPWGQNRVINTHVESSATWLCDCEPTYNHYDNYHLQDSYLDTRGMSGYIYQSTWKDEKKTIISNSTNVAIDGSTFGGCLSADDLDAQDRIQILRSEIYCSALKYTGGTEFIISNSEIRSSTISNTGGMINIATSEVQSGSILTCSNGELDALQSSYETATTITHNSEGRHYDYRSNYASSSRVTNVGTTNNYSYYCNRTSYTTEVYTNTFAFNYILSYSDRVAITYTDVTRVNSYYDNMTSYSIKKFENTPHTCRSYANTLSDRSQMIATNRANGYANFTYCNIHSNSIMNLNDGIAVGHLYACTANSRSNQTYVNGTHYDNFTSSNGQITATNTAISSIRYSQVHGNFTITPTAGFYSSKLKDAINDNW